MAKITLKYMHRCTIVSIWHKKYVRIFVCAHYLLEDTSSFLRVKLLENCELPGKDNV